MYKITIISKAVRGDRYCITKRAFKKGVVFFEKANCEFDIYKLVWLGNGMLGWSSADACADLGLD